MKNLVLTAALAASLCGLASGRAHAAMECGPMRFFAGDSGRNSVAHTSVGYDFKTGQWGIVHHMRDGRDYDRSTQYTMTNFDRTDAVLEWFGNGLSHPNIEMHGMVFLNDGRVWYKEVVYDLNAHKKVVGETVQDCGPAAAPAAPATTTASAPASNVDAVPIMIGESRAHINVMLGGRGVTMLIDTGATNSFLPADVAAQLLKSGAAVEGPLGKSQMANGEIVDTRNILVDTLTIGSHSLHIVRVGVGPVGAEPLLGFDVLSHLGKFSIDPERNQLTFN
jgi:hypothetical protein